MISSVATSTSRRWTSSSFRQQAAISPICSATSLTAWNSGFGEHPHGTRGIDQFIGEPDMIERGHGSAFIRAFVDARSREGVPRIVTDPDPANTRAVRAYQKAGFEKAGMVDTPDGPALLMVRDA